MKSFERKWAGDLLSAYAPETPPASPEGSSPAAGLAPAPGEVDYLETFDRMRKRGTPLAALGLRLAVWVLALAPFWSARALRTVSSLSVLQRSELLGRLLVHPFFIARELALLLKLCASMALLGTASVRARSGYDDVHAAPANQSGLRRRSDRPLDVAASSLHRPRKSA